MTYPRPLRLLHWSIAILVTCQLAIAAVLTQIHSLRYGQVILSGHRQIGLLILILVAVRLALAGRYKAPPASAALPVWQVRAAALVHGVLVLLLLAQPVVGMLVAWGRGDQVGLLGIASIPAPFDISDAARERLMTTHVAIALSLLSLCVVHIGAVLFNRIVRRVSVVGRMLPPVASEKLVNRVPVAYQLMLSFGVVIGIALLVGINSVKVYGELGKATAEFQAGDVGVADQLRAAQVAWKDFYLSTGSSLAGKAQGSDLSDAAKSSLEDALTHARSGEMKSGLARVLRDLSAAVATNASSRIAAVQAVDKELEDLVDSQAMYTVQDQTEYDDLAARGHDLIVVSVLPMVLAGLVAGTLLARSFSGSLGRMRTIIEGIEQDRHELTVHAEGSGEFSRLMRAILQMRVAIEDRARAAAARQAELEADRARLAFEQSRREAELDRQQSAARKAQREQLAAQFQRKVAGIIETVGEAAQALTATASRMATSASTSAQRSRDACLVAENTSRTASEVAARTGELSSKAVAVCENARNSKARAGSAVEEAAQANAQISSLAAAVGQISSITDLIAGVARQTNMLAINARIEAARAGDVGRGFSVVADEVKALALKTAESTHAIEAQILQINTTSRSSSESLARLVRVISGLDESASTIDTVTGAQRASTRQLAEQMSQISSSTSSVAADVQDAQQTANATEQMSENVVQAATMIEGEVIQLRSQVAQFVADLLNTGQPSAAEAETVRPAEDEQAPRRALAS